MRSWPVQDAKARFSELLDTCLRDGPQVVTRRGTEAAVLVPVGQWRQLQQAARPTLKELLLAEEARGDLAIPERGGRRRRHYALTEKGGKALARWQDEPTDVLPELRDLSLLKLFFGGDPRRLAEAQLPKHERQLAGYEQLQEADNGEGPRGIWLSLEAGIAHEREWVSFWRRLAEGR